VGFCVMLLLMLQIDITDVGKDLSVWSVFCESCDMPDVQVSNKDAILCINDPRHASFGRRLLLPTNVQSTCSPAPLIYTFCQFMFM